MKKLLKYDAPEMLVCALGEEDMIRTSQESDFTDPIGDMTTTDKWGRIGG